MKLVITRQVEQNDNADIDKSSNGGGYFQPFIEGKILLEKTNLTFNLNDTSCGEFGNRFEFSIKEGNKDIYINLVNQVGNDYEDSGWNGEYENVLEYLLATSINGIYLGRYINENHFEYSKSLVVEYIQKTI